MLRKTITFFIFTFLVVTPRVCAQQITLMHIPYELIAETDPLTITWQEPIQATLHYGTSHGVYSAVISKSGTKTVTFIPKNEGIQPGVYYGIISNGALRSREFSFIVEAPTSPVMRQPANNSVVQTATPEFQWDEVPGVPFYHLILSDHPAVISRDENGELQISGANVVYQSITSSTHITYGDPDPSGFFTNFNGTSPPLLNGNQYTWIVLNNYGNNPAFTSIVQSGVSSFTVNLNVSLSPPALDAPADKAILSNRTITFKWQSVAGAVGYQIYLFEYVYDENSSSSFLIWSATTSNTSIDFPARAVLKGTEYLWRVLAMDPSGNGIPSQSRNFSYRVPISALNIGTFQLDGTILPRANLAVTPIGGSSDNYSLVTSEHAHIVAAVQPGSYTIRAFKEGFLDTTKTVDIEAGDTLSVEMRLRAASRHVSGDAKDAAGQLLSAVSVFARENTTGLLVNTATDINGHFVLGLAKGLWDIWGQKEHYTNSDTLRLDVRQTTQAPLPRPLVLHAYESYIAGKVVNNSGQPVIAAEVLAHKGQEQVSQFTANNGTFNLQVSAGKWIVTVSKGGFVSPSPRTVQVPAGATVHVSPDLVLQANAGILAGFVFGGQKAVGGAQVTATPPSGLEYTGWTDPKGAYSLNVPPGNYQICVKRKGYHSPEPLQVVLHAGETLSNLNFSLTPNSVSIAGHVTSEGKPLEGAVVRTTGASDTTRADGNYTLWVQPGTYQITAEKSGFAADQKRTVTVKSGENKSGVNFTLTQNVGIVKGSVQEGNQPIVAAWVQAISGDDTIGTESNTLGQYALSLKPGSWSIFASKSGFISKEVNTAIQSGQTITGVDFNLSPNVGTVTGNVKDTRGAPIPGARVQVIPGGVQAVTNRNSLYTLRLEPGNYTLKATANGYGTQTADVHVTANATTTHHFSLTTMGTLTGHIVDSATGQPISQAVVQVQSGGDTLTAYTDYTGEYQLYLKGGTYTLHIDQLGYHARNLTVSVSVGAVKTQNVALVPDPSEIATISGHIWDDFDKAVGGVPISLTGDKIQTYYSEWNGVYEIKKLQTGLKYTVQPKLRGYFFVPEKRRFSPLTSNKVNQDFTAALYGDVSGNKEISSFDGSLILRISAQQNVAPYYKNQPRDSIAADVSGNGQVSSFDASLIFRYSVHLVDRFPVETSHLGKAWQEYSDPVPRIFSANLIHLNQSRWALDVEANNLKAVLSTQWTFWLDEKWVQVEKCVISGNLKNHVLAWSEKGGILSLATAGARPGAGSGQVFRIVLRVKGDASISPETFLRFRKLEVNEGLIAYEFVPPEPGHLPTRFFLYNNFPNPFNGETFIRFAVPGQSVQNSQWVELTIYNVLGEKVRQLVKKKLSPGYYQFRWDGTNESGVQVPGGVYFYRLKSGKWTGVKKLLFLK